MRYRMLRNGKFYTEIETNNVNLELKEFECDSYEIIKETQEQIDNKKAIVAHA